jgi:hypothetical protein
VWVCGVRSAVDELPKLPGCVCVVRWAACVTECHAVSHQGFKFVTAFEVESKEVQLDTRRYGVTVYGTSSYTDVLVFVLLLCTREPAPAHLHVEVSPDNPLPTLESSSSIYSPCFRGLPQTGAVCSTR